MKRPVRIAAVSYLNTIPFLHGIRNSGYLKPEEYELILDYPSKCASSFLNGQSDVALVPVAVLNELDNYKIITNYCLGAGEFVRSVLLVSEVPLENIEEVILDYQSRTSVELVKILAEKLWRKKWRFLSSSNDFGSRIKGSIAGVIIGDRTFGLTYKYQYDLAKAWFDLTGHNFAFAVWLAADDVDKEFCEKLNLALKYGLENITEAVAENIDKISIGKENAEKYLKEDMNFNLDEGKEKSIETFLTYLRLLPNN